MTLSNITFIATVTNRFHCLYSLIISIRKIFGADCKIVVTIQTHVLDEYTRGFLDRYDVVYALTGDDSGLSYNRNRLVDMVKTDYFVLCDDDFVFNESSNLLACVHLMQDKGLNILGGVYKNYLFNRKNQLIKYEKNEFAFNLYIADGDLVKSGVDRNKYEVYNDIFYTKVDCVNNLCIFRTAVFRKHPDLIWDEKMKISGEHIDFYVNNKLLSISDVFFSPNFNVLHVRRTNPEYTKLRSRRAGLERFKSKLKSNQYNKHE